MSSKKQFVTTVTTNSLLIKIYTAERFLESAKFLRTAALNEGFKEKAKILAEGIKDSRSLRDANIILLKGRKLDEKMKSELREVIGKTKFKMSAKAAEVYKSVL